MNFVKDFDELRDVTYELASRLEKENIFFEYFDWDEKTGSVKFGIHWGDWKHDHLRAEWLAEEALEDMGYVVVSHKEEVTEEDGSDCYSATHSLMILRSGA